MNFKKKQVGATFSDWLVILFMIVMAFFSYSTLTAKKVDIIDKFFAYLGVVFVVLQTIVIFLNLCGLGAVYDDDDDWDDDDHYYYKPKKKADPKVLRGKGLHWAVKIADKRDKCVILDTETTGLSDIDEVINLAIIDLDGNILYNSLLRPPTRKSIPREAAKIHGITMKKLKDSPTFADEYEKIQGILAGKTVIAYNAKFDSRLMSQTAVKYGLEPLKRVKWEDPMIPYSNFCGTERWQKLPGASHGALGDCKATKAVIDKMFEVAGC